MSTINRNDLQADLNDAHVAPLSGPRPGGPCEWCQTPDHEDGHICTGVSCWNCPHPHRKHGRGGASAAEVPS